MSPAFPYLNLNKNMGEYNAVGLFRDEIDNAKCRVEELISGERGGGTDGGAPTW